MDKIQEFIKWLQDLVQNEPPEDWKYRDQGLVERGLERLMGGDTSPGGLPVGQHITGVDPLVDANMAATDSMYSKIPWAQAGGPPSIPSSMVAPPQPPSLPSSMFDVPPPPSVPSSMFDVPPPPSVPSSMFDIPGAAPPGTPVMAPLPASGPGQVPQPAPNMGGVRGPISPPSGQPVGTHIMGRDPLYDMVGAANRSLMEKLPWVQPGNAPPQERPRRPLTPEQMRQVYAQYTDATNEPFEVAPEDVTIERIPGGTPKGEAPKEKSGRDGYAIGEDIDLLEKSVQMEEDAKRAEQAQRDELKKVIDNMDPETLARIRAQATMKGNAGSLSGRGGSMAEEDARTEQNMQGPRPLRGGFSQMSDSPELQARLAARDEWTAGQPMRDELFRKEVAQRRGQKYDVAPLEVLRKEADDRAQLKRQQAVDKIYAGAAGITGKIPPHVAANIKMITGEAVPDYMIGRGREEVIARVASLSQDLDKKAQSLQREISSGFIPQESAMANVAYQKMMRDAMNQAIAKLRQPNADPDAIDAELLQAYARANALYGQSVGEAAMLAASNNETDTLDESLDMTTERTAR